MSTYQELKGLKIKYLDSDTSGDRATEGEIFYNSKNFTLGAHISSGIWHSGGALTIKGGIANCGGVGTQTAALMFSGRNSDPGSTQNINSTLSYNGFGWSSAANMNTARHQLASFGTQTAALGASGYVEGSGVTANVEFYDGTSWTEGANVNTARFKAGGAGIQTAGVIAGGRSPSFVKITEEYNGTSWSEQNDLSENKTLTAMCGTQTAAVAAGGNVPPKTANVEEYNGTSWTEVNNLPSARDNGTMSGIQTSGLYVGGTTATATVGDCFTYDGTDFAATTSLGTANYLQGRASNTSDNLTGLDFGGGPYHTRTEEYNVSIIATTGAAFSSGGNMPSAKRLMGGAGTQTAALTFGGFTGPGGLNSTEEYNGSSWTSGGNLGTGRWNGQGVGTQTAGLFVGGAINPIPSPGIKLDVEEYNGSSWSEQNNYPLSEGSYSGAGFGIQTAAVVCGGSDPLTSPTSYLNATREYDGTNWADGGNLNTARAGLSGVGTLTAGLVAGGAAPAAGTPRHVESEEYNGTSWSTGGDRNVAIATDAAFGIQTAALFCGGSRPPADGSVEEYNGTAFVTQVSLTTAREGSAKGPHGTLTAGLVSGGEAPPGLTAATEEWTPESTAASAKTIDFD